MRLFWKIVKIFIYILGGLVVLLFAASFFIEPLAKRLLEKEVGKADEGQYSLQLEEVSLSLLQGDLVLKGIRFRTDSAGHELAPVVSAEVREFSAKGVSWLTFVLERRLLVDQIKLDGVKLQLKARPLDTTDSREPFRFSQLDVYPNLREHVNNIHLQDLELNKIDFTLINALSEDTLRFSAERLDLHSKDILIDADKLITEERAFYAAYIDFDGEQIKLRRSGGIRWTADIDRLNVLTREDQVGISLQSLHYLHSIESTTDTLMLVELQRFELHDLNLNKLQEEEIAAIHKISLSGLDLIHGIDKGAEDNPPKDSLTVEADGGQPDDDQWNKLSDFSMGRFMPEFGKSLVVEILELDDISFRLGVGLGVSRAALKANDIVIDTTSAFSEGRFLHAAALQSTIEELEYLAADAGHRIRWNSLQLEAADGIGHLSIRQLAAEPIIKEAGDPWLDGELALLQIDAIDTRRLEDGILHIRKISTNRPRLFLHLPAMASSNQSSPDNSFPPDLYPALEGLLEELGIERLEVSSGNLELTDTRGSLGQLSIPEINIQLDDLLIRKENAFAQERLLHSKTINLDFRNISYRFPDHRSSLQLEGFGLNSTAESLSLRNLRYDIGAENRDPEQAAQQLSSVATQNIGLKEINFQRLLKGEGLFAGELSLEDTDILLAGSDDRPEEEAERSANKSRPEDSDTDTSLRLADLNLSEQLPDFLKEINLASLKISKVNIHEKQEQMGLENLWLQATALRLNGISAFADNNFLHAATFKTGFDTLWMLEGDPVHHMQAKDFLYSIEDGIGRLELGQTLIIPQEMPRNKPWMEADIPAFVIPHINTRELIAGRLEVGDMVLRRPDVVLYMPAGEAEEAEEQEPSPPDLFPLIEEKLSAFSLKRLSIEDGNVRLAGLGGSYYGMSLHGIDMQLSDLQIAEGTAFENKRLLHAEDISIMLDKLVMLFPDKVYSLQLSALALSSARQHLRAESLIYQYGDNYEKILEDSIKNDLYRLVNDELLVEGINYQKLFRDNEFHAQTVSLNGMDLYIYKDLNKPEADRIKPMPRGMIFNMGIPLSIGSLQTEDFAITYEEMAEGAESAGLVTLMDVSVDIDNISNISDELQKQPRMEVKASGRLMGKGYFETEMDVPLLDEHEKLRIRGSIDTLDMSRLNRISRYNSRIAIEEGTLHKASWDFEANGDIASGSFEVSYQDLKVQLSSQNSPDTTGVLKDIGSYLLNLVVVDSNIAEKKTKEPKKVTFEEKRDKKKSFFNFYVQSLLTGLMEAIGVPI